MRLSDFLRNRHLLDAVTGPVYAIDAEKKVIYHNRPFLSLSLHGARVLKQGQGCRACLRLAICEKECIWEASRRAERPLTLREIGATDGRERPLSLMYSCTPLWDDELSLIVGGLLSVTDLSVEEEVQGKYRIAFEEERQARQRAERLNEELQRAYEELKSLDRMKATFIDLVSHELRTPVTGVMVTSEIFQDPEALSSEEVKEFGGILYEQTQKLVRMINDIVDLSQMVGGTAEFVYAESRLDGLVREAMAEMRDTFRDKDITLHEDLEGGQAPARLESERVLQVARGILSNAAQFTPPGGQVWVRTWDEEGRTGFTIRDSGIGISEEHLASIFRFFEQVEDINTHSEGRGLGLALAQMIIEKGHGGRIWAESGGEGTGSTFHVAIPRLQPEGGVA